MSETPVVPAQDVVIADAVQATGEPVENVTEVAALPIPPKGGPNASGAAWAAYALQEIAARGLHIEIAADAGRNDIIDALKSAGIPTE